MVLVLGSTEAQDRVDQMEENEIQILGFGLDDLKEFKEWGLYVFQDYYVYRIGNALYGVPHSGNTSDFRDFQESRPQCKYQPVEDLGMTIIVEARKNIERTLLRLEGAY